MEANKASRLVFSSLFRQLCRQSEAAGSALVPKAHFSSIPHRPMRGGGDDRRTRTRDDPLDDVFLRSLGEEDPSRARESPPSHAPDRSWRSERSGGASQDFFSELNERSEKLGQSRVQSKPMGGREFKVVGGHYAEGFDVSGRKSSSRFSRSPGSEPTNDGSFKLTDHSPVPDRPPRGAQREVTNADVGDRKEDPGVSLLDSPPQNDRSFKIGDWLSDSVSRAKGEDRSRDTLFEKLNLGNLGRTKKGEETEQTPSADSPVAEPSAQDADEIFKKMKQTGLIPNAVAMLDGLCKDGLIQEAMKLFGLMREKGTIPEVVIYTAVVEGFCKAAKFDDAKRIFRKMQKNGINPNTFSYTVLIQGLCKGNRLEDAVEFCMEMLDAGHSPNAATFTGLVDGFCKDKGVEEAESLVQRLRERGYAMDEKAVREHMEKKGPFSPTVWEAIFRKKTSQRPF